MPEGRLDHCVFCPLENGNIPFAFSAELSVERNALAAATIRAVTLAAAFCPGPPVRCGKPVAKGMASTIGAANHHLLVRIVTTSEKDKRCSIVRPLNHNSGQASDCSPPLGLLTRRFENRRIFLDTAAVLDRTSRITNWRC